MKPRQHRLLLLIIAIAFVAAVFTNVFVVPAQALRVAVVGLGVLLVIGVGVFLVKKAKGHYR
jgi:Mn2+/Fe2+ NRAMP family transporter